MARCGLKGERNVTGNTIIYNQPIGLGGTANPPEGPGATPGHPGGGPDIVLVSPEVRNEY